MISKPVSYHLGPTPEIPRLPRVDSNDPHFGSFSLETGPVTIDGFIDQVIPTVAGTAYDVSFWLENYDDTGNNRFGASFGGITLVPEAIQGPFGYTLYTFNNVMPGANADLHFIFYNPTFSFTWMTCVSPSADLRPLLPAHHSSTKGSIILTICPAGLC